MIQRNPKLRASINGNESGNIPSIDHASVIDPPTLTHLEDSIMEATLCQAAETNVVEITTEEQKISTLTSTELSFAGGGLMAVMFA